MIEFFRSAWLPMLVILAIVAVIVFIVVLVLRSRRRKAPEEEADEDFGEEAVPPQEELEPAVADSSESLRGSFSFNMRRLRTQVGRHARYEMPWFMLLGADGSRPRDLLANLGMGLPFGPPEMLPRSGAGCAWWFFDRAIVLDLGDAYLLREGSRATDEKGWRSFLDLLQKHRPERPVDGVILTVSCLELLEARRQGAAGMADLERRSTALYRKLAEVRGKLGIRFPLYVVVTGCERLPGFVSSCAALPPRRRREIFGWSSPYSVETPFHDGWVEEAFQSFDQRLREIQQEVFATGVETADTDELVLYPATVQAIKEPLRAFLSRAVSANAYLGSMLLRGFYLCGTAQDSAPAPVAYAANLSVGNEESFESGSSPGFWQPEETIDHTDPRGQGGTEGATQFLRDLLEEKIFPEAALGRPTTGTLVARNRLVRAVQVGLLVTALILGLGLWNAHKRLSARKDQLHGFLRNTSTALGEQEGELGRGSGHERAGAERRARELADGMGEIDAGWFGSAFLPASWLSPFNADLERSFLVAYDKIIFQALIDGLNLKATELTTEQTRRSRDSRSRLRGDDTTAGETVAIDRMPEFEAFDRHVAELAELDRATRRYNDLRQSQDVGELGHVIEYLFDITLSEGFFSRAGLYESALRDVPLTRFDPAVYSEAAQRRVGNLARDFNNALSRVFVRDLDRVSTELQDLGLPVEEKDITRKARDIERLVDSITRVEQALERPEADWAFRQDFDLGPKFESLMSLIAQSTFLGSKLADELEANASFAWRQYRTVLNQAYQTDLTGALLKPSENGNGRMELSIEVLRLQAALEKLLSFTRVNNPRQFRQEIADGERLTWETRFLDQAVNLDGQYQRFRDKQISALREEDAGPTLETVARITMTAKIIDLLARAQRFEPAASDTTFREEFLTEEIKVFETANQPLDKILKQLDRFQASQARLGLSSLMADQSLGLLEDVEQVLEQEKLYEPRRVSLAAWDGELPASYAAYGVRDEAGMTFYLDRQRQRLDHLAGTFAEPLVKWLLHAEVDNPRYRRWSGIVKGLKEYELQQAGNPLAELERKILEVLPQRRLEECARTDPPGGELRESEEFFRQKENELYRQVYRQCRTLAVRRAHQGYEEITDYFNRRLAGKFPFASATIDRNVEQPSVGVFATEAEPDDLRGFFRVFDTYRPFLVDDKKQADEDGWVGDLLDVGSRRTEVEQFLERVVGVREFFAHFLDGEDPAARPAFDVEVEFRVNRNDEDFGNMIIGWDLEVGARKINFREAEKRARWELDRPVRLDLRWAKDAPWKPVATAGLPEISGDGRSLVYGYANRWALVSFLAEHRYRANLADRRPHTLAFEIQRREASADGNEVDPTRIFVRLTVRVPDSKEPVEMPEFPYQAPVLDEQSRSTGTGSRAARAMPASEPGGRTGTSEEVPT